MATFTVKRWKEFETDDPSLSLVPPEHHPYAWLAPRWWYRGDRTIYETCAKVVNSEYQIYIDGYTPAMEIEVTIGGGDIVLGDGCLTSTLKINAATTLCCDLLPEADVTVNLGSVDKRFANIYTGDLHLKNDRGDWTVIEEEDCLTMRNNKTGKRYAISMTPYGG